METEPWLGSGMLEQRQMVELQKVQRQGRLSKMAQFRESRMLGLLYPGLMQPIPQ